MEFHNKANLSKAVSPSFLSLIPKVDNPQNLAEFRPISLVGSMYMIVAKTLGNKLKGVMDKLVSKSQTTFIPVRHIQE